MSETSEDFLASLVTMPWRPRSLRAPRKEPLGIRWRVVILASVTVLHLLGVAWFLKMLAADEEATTQVVFVVTFVDAAPPPAPPPPPPPPPEVMIVPVPRSLPSPVRPSQPIRTPSSPPTDTALQAQPSPRKSEALHLYNSDGTVHVPDDLVATLDRQVSDERIFSYQIPHIDDAKKYFYRNPALTFETTRFDKYWTPDQDALTALLTKLVEKTTKEIRIPVPGSPGSTMVCKVSILAMGGGCGIITSGSDYVGPLDDPATLSPEEDRQCQAWWNQIVGAKTQDIWRKTRSLYEAQCRKPLARAH